MLKKIFSALSFIAILIVILIAGQIGKDIGKHVGNVASSSPEPSPQQIEEKLIEGFTIAAQQINQRGPIMVDNDTRMDRASVGPGARLIYHYTLPSYTSQDIDPSWLQANLRPVAKKNVCANEKMKLSLQYGGIYVYAYSGKNGVEVARFEINKNDCTQPTLSVQQIQNLSDATQNKEAIVAPPSPTITPASSGTKTLKLRVKKNKGDLRHCLSLGSNEAIAQCVERN